MSLLRVQDLQKSFGAHRAVQGLSFSLEAGEMLALIGPNGAGKSTTFNMLNGQIRPDHGQIEFKGKSLIGLGARQTWQLGVSRTFQIAQTFGSLSLAENVQMALICKDHQLFSFWPRAHDFKRDEALALLRQVELHHMADKACSALAYGDIKRLELAQALANEPTLLLMDEPTAGMGPLERKNLMALVKELVLERGRSSRGLAVLFTEHSMDVVFGFADRVLVMSAGALIAEGTVEEIKANERVQALYFGYKSALEPARSSSTGALQA